MTFRTCLVCSEQIDEDPGRGQGVPSLLSHERTTFLIRHILDIPDDTDDDDDDWKSENSSNQCKFDQTVYCQPCKEKIASVKNAVEQLAALEKIVLDGKIEIEKKLRAAHEQRIKGQKKFEQVVEDSTDEIRNKIVTQLDLMKHKSSQAKASIRGNKIGRRCSSPNIPVQEELKLQLQPNRRNENETVETLTDTEKNCCAREADFSELDEDFKSPESESEQDEAEADALTNNSLPNNNKQNHKSSNTSEDSTTSPTYFEDSQIKQHFKSSPSGSSISKSRKRKISSPAPNIRGKSKRTGKIANSLFNKAKEISPNSVNSKEDPTPTLSNHNLDENSETLNVLSQNPIPSPGSSSQTKKGNTHTGKPAQPGIKLPGFTMKNVPMIYENYEAYKQKSNEITEAAGKSDKCCGICAIHGSLEHGNRTFEEYYDSSHKIRHAKLVHLETLRCAGCNAAYTNELDLIRHMEWMQVQPSRRHRNFNIAEENRRKRAALQASKRKPSLKNGNRRKVNK